MADVPWKFNKDTYAANLKDAGATIVPAVNPNPSIGITDKADQVSLSASANAAREKMLATYNQNTNGGTLYNTPLGQPMPSQVVSQPNTPNTDVASITDTSKANADATAAASKAAIDAAVSAQIAGLEKAYQNAVMNGEMSVNEARAAYESQKKGIEVQAYRDAQGTTLAAEDRGIGNSQQLLGLQAGDNARNQGLLNQNMTQRDRQIADIQTRLRNMSVQKQIDVTQATAQGAFKTAEMTAEANAQHYQNMFGFNSQNYFANQGQAFNRENMGIQQGYNQQNMETQQGYTQDNMETQQGYTQDNMNLGHKLDLSKMSQQQKYAVEQITMNFKNDLKKMEVGQGYDMQKIGAQFANQMKAMAKQNGYDNARMEKQIIADTAKLEKQIAAEQSQYELSRSRELAKFVPGSTEYTIREAQLKDSHENAVAELHTKTMYESRVNLIMEDAKAMDFKPPVAPRNPSASELSSYNKKLEAYGRYKNLIDGKSTGENMMDNTYVDQGTINQSLPAPAPTQFIGGTPWLYKKVFGQ